MSLHWYCRIKSSKRTACAKDFGELTGRFTSPANARRKPLIMMMFLISLSSHPYVPVVRISYDCRYGVKRYNLLIYIQVLNELSATAKTRNVVWNNQCEVDLLEIFRD